MSWGATITLGPGFDEEKAIEGARADCKSGWVEERFRERRDALIDAQLDLIREIIDSHQEVDAAGPIAISGHVGSEGTSVYINASIVIHRPDPAGAQA